MWGESTSHWWILTKASDGEFDDFTDVSLKLYNKQSIEMPWSSCKLYCNVIITHWPQEIRRKIWISKFQSKFYPRPILAFGYCHCLCLLVRPSLRVSVKGFPCDNSCSVQTRITKFGPKVQNTLVKVPIVLGSDWLRPSRSNFTKNSNFTQFWPLSLSTQYLLF